MELIDRVAKTLAPHGLRPRGGFHPGEADHLAAATLVLVGNVGPAMWRAFQRAGAELHAAHPLNHWSEQVIGAAARALGATAVFPFQGPPYPPFQRWAQRAEAVSPSPLGILIHPEFGLWHAYRGALLFPEHHALPPPDERPSPCRSCREKPCLGTCPVDAFRPEGYDVAACRRHISTPAGGDCLTLGCRARRACPIGRDYVYAPAQAEFHMAAFRDA